MQPTLPIPPLVPAEFLNQRELVVLVALMSAFTAGGGCAFRVVGEVVGIVLFAAANLLLRYTLMP